MKSEKKHDGKKHDRAYAPEGSKNPYIAAGLNFFVSGFGYLYLGKKVTFAMILLGAEALMFLWFFTSPEAVAVVSEPLLFLASLGWGFAFAFDAFQLAKE